MKARIAAVKTPGHRDRDDDLAQRLQARGAVDQRGLLELHRDLREEVA